MQTVLGKQTTAPPARVLYHCSVSARLAGWPAGNIIRGVEGLFVHH